MVPTTLVFASAAVMGTLGFLHLTLTFFGSKLTPRDRELQARMEAVSPVISRETTMWKAWIGFNASHSFGAILFGAVYGYLSLVQNALLFRSLFLGCLGALLLLGYLVLAKKFWFSIPFGGIMLASILYVAGFAVSLA